MEEAKGMEEKRSGEERRGGANVVVRKVRLTKEDVVWWWKFF